MTTRDALIAAIVANPDDTTARLVFADWLDETGNEQDAAHAELIRVQCELSSQRRGAIAASEDNDRVQDALESRERELLTNNIELARPIAELFVEPNPCPLVHYVHSGCYDPTAIGKAIGWEWRSGFIEKVRVPMSVFMSNESMTCRDGDGESKEPVCSSCKMTWPTQGFAADLVSRCPIRRVEFTDREPYTSSETFHYWPCTAKGWDRDSIERHRELFARYDLPPELFDYVEGESYDLSYMKFKSYATRDLAIDTLSRAAIAYARKRAGLPEWVPQTEGE